MRPIDGEPAAQSVPAATHARTLGSAKVAASGGTDHRATLVRKLTTTVTHPLASARMAPHRLRSASKKVRASTRVQKAAARAIPGGVRSEFGAFPNFTVDSRNGLPMLTSSCALMMRLRWQPGTSPDSIHDRGCTPR